MEVLPLAGPILTRMPTWTQVLKKSPKKLNLSRSPKKDLIKTKKRARARARAKPPLPMWALPHQSPRKRRRQVTRMAPRKRKRRNQGQNLNRRPKRKRKKTTRWTLTKKRPLVPLRNQKKKRRKLLPPSRDRNRNQLLNRRRMVESRLKRNRRKIPLIDILLPQSHCLYRALRVEHYLNATTLLGTFFQNTRLR